MAKKKKNSPGPAVGLTCIHESKGVGVIGFGGLNIDYNGSTIHYDDDHYKHLFKGHSLEVDGYDNTTHQPSSLHAWLGDSTVTR